MPARPLPTLTSSSAAPPGPGTIEAMSTKIYDGYRIALGGTDLLAFVADFDRRANAVYAELFDRVCTRLATFNRDHVTRVAAGLEPALDRTARDLDDHIDDTTIARIQTANHLVNASLLLDDAHTQITRTGRRNPRLDLGCQVTIMPGRDGDDAPTDGPAYAILYTENAAYRTAWEAMPGVERYGYWNSTDKPDDVTDTEWDQRRDTWQYVLAGAAPARRGLTWSLLGDTHHRHHGFATPTTNLDRHIPTRTERAMAIARRTYRTTETDLSVLMDTLPDLLRAHAATIEGDLDDIDVTDLVGVSARTNGAGAES